MNDRTMIKVRCDKELLYIRTISWQKKSPHRFAILRSELQKLEQEPNKRVLTSDCGPFAIPRLFRGRRGYGWCRVAPTLHPGTGNTPI